MVQLFKNQKKYVDRNGQEKVATNFYLKLGDVLVPIEPKYFQDKETGLDKAYVSRKTLMSALAETLPSRPSNSANKETLDTNNEKMVEVEDSPLPF